MENTEEVILQWIKGDKFGSVETIKSTEGEWTIFNSGGRIATNLLNEFLEPVNGDPLEFEPPSPALKRAAEIYKEKVPQKTVSSPIRTLFDKQKKNDKIKLNLTFPIEVPKKAIYEIISSSLI